MVEKKIIMTPEELDEIKRNLVLDDAGMITMLGKRYVITPQDTFSDMMVASADIGGLNFARVFMRRAGFEAAYKVCQSMIENLGLTGEDLVIHYTKVGGKRGWSFDAVEELDLKNNKFLCKAYYSPFVIRFNRKTNSPVCDFLRGVFEAMCFAAGYREIRIVETKCVAMGDEFCQFECKNE